MPNEKLRTFQPQAVDRLHHLTGIPLAGFWNRAGAFVVDFALVCFFAAIADVVVHLKEILASSETIHLQVNPFHGPGIVTLVLYFSLALFWGKGQTIGKRLFRIRVISLVHGNMSFWHCVERALGYGASLLEGGFGFVQFFIHPNRQTAHDRLAETIVVYDKPPVQAPQAG